MHLPQRAPDLVRIAHLLQRPDGGFDRRNLFVFFFRQQFVDVPAYFFPQFRMQFPCPDTRTDPVQIFFDQRFRFLGLQTAKMRQLFRRFFSRMYPVGSAHAPPSPSTAFTAPLNVRHSSVLCLSCFSPASVTV